MICNKCAAIKKLSNNKEKSVEIKCNQCMKTIGYGIIFSLEEKKEDLCNPCSYCWDDTHNHFFGNVVARCMLNGNIIVARYSKKDKPIPTPEGCLINRKGDDEIQD